jgi:hypothetical protein
MRSPKRRGDGFLAGFQAERKRSLGFYVGEDDGAYQILGGNQSDSVCLAWLNKIRFISAHWPSSATKLINHAVMKERDEGLSLNEA